MADLLSALSMPWAASVLLLSARLAALFLMTPVLYALPLPPTVRVLLTLGLAAALALPFAADAGPGPSLAGLADALLAEVAIGATLGLGVLMAFAGFALAGRLLDVQVGFGMAQVFDPLTRSQVPVLTSAMTWIGVLLFFLLNGHHALLRGIAFSLERFPLGQPWSVSAAAGPMLKQAASLFTLGFARAAPLVLALLMLEFVLGVLARNLPQANMLMLGLPVKIAVGLLLLSLWTGAMEGITQRMHQQIVRGWTSLFNAVPPLAEQLR